MAKEIELFDISLEAGADLSALQHHFVKQDASGNAVVCGDGERAFGVLQNTPTSGQGATVRTDGVAKIVAGGAIAIGAQIACNGSGRAESAATSTDAILGEAMSATGADGELLSAKLYHNGLVP